MTMQEFIKANKIRMTAERTDTNPHMDSSNMDHWKVKLTLDGAYHLGRKQLTTYFSMDYGHNGKEPQADDVLDCLASDASGFENSRSFEDWAGDYGYDPDSRKAEKIYKTVERQSAKLKNFLGDDLYKTLLWDTERL